MISRRLIRIKVLQMAYAHIHSIDKQLDITEKELINNSLKSSTDLYYLTFSLLSDIRYMAAKRIDAAKNKYIPTEDDLNPNMRFAENPVILKIEQTQHYQNYISNNVISWDNDETTSYFLNKIVASDIYKTYMSEANITFKKHVNFIVDILTTIILTDQVFYQYIEERNIYWNDDYSTVLPNVIRTIKSISEKKDILFEDQTNTEEDKNECMNYARILIRRTILDRHQYDELISQYTVNWNIDRMSEMDRLIMDLAITEWINFPEIPVKVTINEYLEIAKNYSSEKSNGFINGVLDKILSNLKESGKIQKAGRGLVE